MHATIDPGVLQTFCAAAETLHFGEAARRRGMDKSTVSRDIKTLEREIGGPLFHRSTRAVRLTPDGHALFEALAPSFRLIEAAIARVRSRGDAPAGVVSVATTPEIARLLLAPALVELRRAYPGIQLELSVGDALLDLTSNELDLAVRVGKPGAASLVATRVGALVSGFYAASGYLAQAAPLRAPTDLAWHDGLWPTPPSGHRSFSAGRKPPRPAVACADFAVLAELARSGAGVALLPTFVAEPLVRRGELQNALPDHTTPSAPVYVVSRAITALAPKTKVTRAHLIAHLRRVLATAPHARGG